MSMSIHDEAVGAALKATNEGGYHHITGISVVVILEAAAPYLKAQAWAEAHFDAIGCDGSCCDFMHDAPRKTMNPYGDSTPSQEKP